MSTTKTERNRRRSSVFATREFSRRFFRTDSHLKSVVLGKAARTPRASERRPSPRGGRIEVFAVSDAPRDFENACFAMTSELMFGELVDWICSRWKDHDLSTLVVVGSTDDQPVLDRLRELPQALRVLRFGPDDILAKTVMRALHGDAAPTTILQAYWDGAALRVVNAALTEIRVPMARLLQIKGLQGKHLARFEIDLGDLHFPDPDIHLDWDSLVDLVDPDAALRAKQESEEFNRRYGASIRAFREQRGIRQSDVDGLSERQIHRIEGGEQRATLKSLQKLASAHRMALNEYLAAIAEAMV